MFKVLRSSAGAGKTHALVKHYLGHCLGTTDHGAYRHVLALTFTNKAAAEMKERVVHYLEGLAQGGPFDGPLGDVADHLQQQAGIDAAELARRAEVVLRHMLHHWSAVSISTIDAFTRRVVKPFARDLRLDHDLRMTTEQEFYRTEAVSALIDRAGHDGPTTRMLTLTCMELLKEERPWEPTRPLLDLSKELLNERSIGPLRTLRDRSLEEVTELGDRLSRSTARFRQEVRRIGKEAVDLFARTNVPKDEIAYSGTVLNYFLGLARFKDEWNAPGPNTTKPIQSGKLQAGKATAEHVAALQGIHVRVAELFDEAEALRASGYADHVVQRAVMRELLPSFALHSIDLALEELKQADGVAFFSDLTRRVAEVVKDEPVPFIYERLGEHFRHFLIDEFQDTSVLQWNALLPLLDNALSTGGTVLLVGDAKQAIYRWRNGEVRLFVELPKLFAKEEADAVLSMVQATFERTWSPAEPLALNRRSAKGIITFNNTLFDALAGVLPENIRRVYDGSAQQTWRPEAGTIRVRVGQEKEGAAMRDEMLAHALESLRLAIAAGHRPGEVAVLVRSKRVGRAVAEHFQANGFAVVSPDGLQLASDPAVQLLIECLRFIHQDDAISAARALQWQAVVNGASQGSEPVPWQIHPRPDGRPDARDSLRQYLRAHGAPTLRTTLTALIEALAHCFGIDPIADAALLTLLDEAHAWSTEHTQDIAGFLEHWDRSGGDRSSGGGVADAVQVMTIHKSKGLQFPVVIIPDARMVSSRAHGELFWMDPGDAVPGLEQALVKESKSLRGIDLPELIEEQGLRDLDALNLLYVAFTRAEQRLFIFIPPGKDPVTRALLTFVEGNGHLFDAEVPPAPERPHAEAEQPLTLHNAASPQPNGSWRIRLGVEHANTGAEEREYGTAVHALLARVDRAEDVTQAVQLAVVRGDLEPTQATELIERLTTALSSPPLSRWFSGVGGARAEAAIITADGSSLRPDRVVEDEQGMHVLEIKTGKPAPAHRTQLSGYMDTLRTMGYSKVEGTIWYLTTGTTEHVIA